MFVQDFMTNNPITIATDGNILDAEKKMLVKNIHRLPVVDKNGVLVGIVTDGDVRRAMPSTATSLDKFELHYLLGKIKIEDIMTVKPFTIEADAVLEKAALIMYKNHIGGVVVTDEEQHPIGIITATDVFKVLVDSMGLGDGKTRVTLELPDKIGQLNILTGIFKDLNINIGSLVTKPLAEEKMMVVVRAANVGDTQALAEKLQAAGFKVLHIAAIS